MRIEKKGAKVKVRMSFWEKVWSLHGDFEIPKDDIVSIKDELPKSNYWQFRFPGSHFPGLIKSGSYYTKYGWEFWYWSRFRRYCCTIELKNSKYKRLILSDKSKLDL